MKEKKELKRYYLVEYVGIRQKAVDSLEEALVLLKESIKYNNRLSSKYLFGNITIMEVDNGYVITSHVYNKLTSRSTISDIDALTSKYSEKELIDLFKDKTKTMKGFTPDINVAYFGSSSKADIDGFKCKINYIPVLYKDDVCFLDKEYIKKCLKFHAQSENYDFFIDMANKFIYSRPLEEIRERLYEIVGEVRSKRRSKDDMYYTALSLYEAYIRERDNGRLVRNENGEYQISRRRLRDFGFYIRDYGMLKSKISSPLKYNKPVASKGEEIEENNSEGYSLKLKQ